MSLFAQILVVLARYRPHRPCVGGTMIDQLKTRILPYIAFFADRCADPAARPGGPGGGVRAAVGGKRGTVAKARFS